MQRTVLASLYALLIALTVFLTVYLGIESFDIREDDYIEIAGEFYDLTPQLLVPVKFEQLVERFPERVVIGWSACILLLALAALLTRGAPRFTQPIAGFVLAAAGGFIIYVAAVYFYGYTDWGSSMLSALSLAPAVGAYCLSTFLFTQGARARLGDLALILFSVSFAIGWTQILRFFFS